MRTARIVVLNHDPTFLHFMNRFLTQAGYDVVPLQAGVDAFDAIVREAPDLVILDLWLEAPDAGWQVLKQLEGGSQTATLAIIISTAPTERLERERTHLLKRGRRILEKPFDGAELLTMIHEMLAVNGTVRDAP